MDHPHHQTMHDPAWPEAPLDVFYVVHSTGPHGKREHRVRSILYQEKLHADAELARLRAGDPEGLYDIWHTATYVEPATWLYDVLLADGTLIHPGTRQHGGPFCQSGAAG